MSEKTQEGAPKPKRQQAKSLIMCGEQLTNLYNGAAEAKKRGEKVAWATSIFPQEITTTLGLWVLYPENHSAGVAARHLSESFLQYAEGPAEYNNDLCAYAKTNLAYMELLHVDGSHNMAAPDLMLCANNICNQVTKWYQNISHVKNIPMFMIDCCYNYDNDMTDSRTKYMRAQLDKLIKDLCEFTGKKWDQDKFNEVMRISCLNKDLWLKANELLAAVPSPLNGFDLFNYMSCMVCCRGESSTTDILNQLISEIEENIATGKSSYPDEQKYRVFWEGIACWPYLGHNLKTLRKYGINMVATPYATAWALDYEVGDLDGMAKAYSFTTGNNVSLETLVKRRADSLRKFKCDGMIYHVNRSCKVMDCQQYEVQRQLTELTGVPFMTFDGDQADFRNYSEAQFETRVEAFADVMRQNKEARKNA